MVPLPFSRTRYFPSNDRATMSVDRLKYVRARTFFILFCCSNDLITPASKSHGAWRRSNQIGENVERPAGSKVPSEAAHKKARIAGYEMDIVDAGRLITQTGLKVKRCLLPFGIEQ